MPENTPLPRTPEREAKAAALLAAYGAKPAVHETYTTDQSAATVPETWPLDKPDEQPESSPLRSLSDFLDNRDLGVRTTMLHGHELVIGKLNTGYRPLTEAETSTVLALFALVALEWVAR